MFDVAVLAVFYIVAGSTVGFMWHLLAKGSPNGLPPEFRFRFWSPNEAGIRFYVLIGVVWPLSFPVMFVWCAGWFLIAGTIAAIREYVPSQLRELSIKRPAAWPFGF